MDKVHYLDNAATTKLSERARAAALDAIEQYANPSSIHSAGRAARAVLDKARGSVAQALYCASENVVFTSGGTESINWALICGTAANRAAGSHIVTLETEHSAVLDTVKHLLQQGCTLTLLKPVRNGTLNLDGLRAALRPDTALVSLALVNNETGVINPIADVVQAVRELAPRALLHVDAVQALIKIPLNNITPYTHLLSVSAHKVHGLKGSGALYIRPGVRLPPLLHGGGQEGGLRPGTEALPAIAAFGTALEEGLSSLGRDAAHMADLKSHLLAEIARALPGVRPLFTDGAPHIQSIAVPGCPSEVAVRILEGRRVFVSPGAACARGKRSHVLTACGLDPRLVDSALRVSFSRYSTREDVDALVAGLTEVWDKLGKPI